MKLMTIFTLVVPQFQPFKYQAYSHILTQHHKRSCKNYKKYIKEWLIFYKESAQACLTSSSLRTYNNGSSTTGFTFPGQAFWQEAA